MEKRALSPSNVANLIWGRYINTEGKNVARGRDRLSVWLAGKNIPAKNNLEKLAKALGVEPVDLMPQAIAKKAPHGVPLPPTNGAADWSFTQPSDGGGKVFVQISMFVSPETAYIIQGALLQDRREPSSR